MTQPPGYGPPPGYPPAVPGPPPPGYWPGPPPPGYWPGPPPPPGHYWPVPPPPPVSPAGVPLAEFWQRLVAVIIDTALLTAALLVVALPAFVVILQRLPDPEAYAYDTGPGRFLADFFVPILLLELGLLVLMQFVYYLYAVEYMHRSGQTLGKRIMKIRVVPIDPSRTALTRGMAAKRYLVEYVAGGFVPFFRYLDGLWQLWDKPYQQALHDKAAQTVVVKVFP